MKRWLLLLVLTTACSAPEEPYYRRHYRELWKNPCAWKTATQAEKIIRVTTLPHDEDWPLGVDYRATIEAQELQRCTASEGR